MARSLEDLENGKFLEKGTGQTSTVRIGGNYATIPQDSSTNTLMTIDYEHHEIHSGSHFYICGYETLGNGAATTFTVITPNTTEWAHMTFSIYGTQAIIFEVKEGATVNTTGTATTPLNNDRNSAHTSVLTIRNGDTFTGEGTTIYSAYIGAGRNSGDITHNKELILKQNTTYIFRITNTQATNTVTSYCGEWYEHTNKN